MLKFSPLKVSLLVALTLALLAVSLSSSYSHWFGKLDRTNNPETAHRLARLPKFVLWAWERPEDLRSIDPRVTAVAPLLKTINLRSDRISVRPRLQPLNVPPETQIIAVARLESDKHDRPSLTSSQIDEVVSEVVKMAKLSGVVAVQIDYDALASERIFYRKLLFELRRRLPNATGLSITALASWCQGDNWLDELPIDEAVPMVFRMGVESKQFRAQVGGGTGFRSAMCQKCLGISLDELVELPPDLDRLYVFNPRPWSSTKIRSFLESQ